MHDVQYISRNMHMVFALLCFVVVIHWLIFPYPSGLLHWHCGNLTIAPVPAKQPWWIWINTSCEYIMNDCRTTTKQSTTKPCAYFLGYTVISHGNRPIRAVVYPIVYWGGMPCAILPYYRTFCALCACHLEHMPEYLWMKYLVMLAKNFYVFVLFPAGITKYIVTCRQKNHK